MDYVRVIIAIIYKIFYAGCAPAHVIVVAISEEILIFGSCSRKLPRYRGSKPR
jgi:hypothetical protein